MVLVLGPRTDFPDGQSIGTRDEILAVILVFAALFVGHE